MLMDWQRSVKMAALLKAIYRFNTIPTKILTQFFTEIGRTIFRFTQEGQAPRIAETVLSDERTLAGITVPDCESDSRAPVIKNIVGTKTGTLINGTEEQDVSLYTCGLLIFFFNKEAKIGEKKATNGTAQTGLMCGRRRRVRSPPWTRLHVDQGSSGYPESDRREVGNRLEVIGTGKDV